MCGWKGQMNEMGKKESCRKMVRSGLTDPRFTPSFHQTRARDLGLRFLSMRAVMGSTAPWLSRLLRRHYGQLRLWVRRRRGHSQERLAKNVAVFTTLSSCAVRASVSRWQGAAL